MDVELLPEDRCCACHEEVAVLDAVFVLGSDDSVQLMCERCVAAADPDRLNLLETGHLAGYRDRPFAHSADSENLYAERDDPQLWH